ncbi:hypothetical protein KC686_00945 [Candidatus Woesebacteria bacterium]|nr:hypothetical protein [Candidatus Woesebacteria bacterium]
MRALVLQSALFSFIFCAPINFFYVFSDTYAYTAGLRSDYLLLRVWAVVLPALILVFLGRHTLLAVLNKHLRWQYGIVLILCVLTQLLSLVPLVSVFHLTQIILIALASILLFKQKNTHWDTIKAAVWVTLLFQTALGTYQVLTQSSLMGYALLGEPSIPTIGLSSAHFFGVETILAYGSTAHPNILAGMGALFSGIIVAHTPTKKESMLAIAVASWLCLFTLSVSGAAALLITLVAYFRPNVQRYITTKRVVVLILISLCLPLLVSNYTDNQSISRRALLLENAARTTWNHPLGTGIGQSTLFTSPTLMSTEIARFVQPVHNVFVLFLEEWGVVIGVFVFWLIYKHRRYFSAYSATLLPLLLWDHYLLSMESGVALLCIYLALTSMSAKQHE